MTASSRHLGYPVSFTWSFLNRKLEQGQFGKELPITVNNERWCRCPIHAPLMGQGQPPGVWLKLFPLRVALTRQTSR